MISNLNEYRAAAAAYEQQANDPTLHDVDDSVMQARDDAAVRLADTVVSEGVAALLSVDAVAVVAGLIAPTSEVHHDGIYTSDPVWEEIRTAFPLAVFTAWAERHRGGTDGGNDYDPEAGT